MMHMCIPSNDNKRGCRLPVQHKVSYTKWVTQSHLPTKTSSVWWKPCTPIAPIMTSSMSRSFNLHLHFLGLERQSIVAFTWLRPIFSDPYPCHNHIFISSWDEQSTNHSSLKTRPRCYAKSPTGQDAFQAIPGLISCAGVTRRWGVLSHAQNAVR